MNRRKFLKFIGAAMAVPIALRVSWGLEIRTASDGGLLMPDHWGNYWARKLLRESEAPILTGKLDWSGDVNARVVFAR